MLKKLVDSNFSQNKQNVINMVASLINMLITTMISFILSPYIIRTIGVEANGFVTLANSFISYATIARTALNSMGSRFLMMAYYNHEDDKVEKYYSSLFFADLILAAVLGCLGAVCVWKLEYVLNIPKELITDVKLLFGVLFLNFLISTIITVWSTTTYIRNKLYLDSISQAGSTMLRAISIVALFMCLEPSVCIVGIGTLVGGVFSCFLQFYYKRYLFKDLKAKLSNFSWLALKTLLSSGVWNAISSLGTVLANGLDLLVANLFVGATDMGVLSVAKTMPSFIDTLNYTLASVFVPSLIIDYAKGQTDKLVETIKKSAKIISVICSLPLAFLLVYGKQFYSLWQPTQEAELLYLLSVITIFGRVFFTGMQPLFEVFTVVNKVKQNSLVTVLNGFLSVGITCVLLSVTDLGIYAIAGVSVGCCFVKNIIFVIPFAAKYLQVKMTTFYSTLIPSISCCVILCIWGGVESLLISGNTWLSLIFAGIVFVCVGVILTTWIVLSSEERRYLFSIMKSRLTRS